MRKSLHRLVVLCACLIAFVDSTTPANAQGQDRGVISVKTSPPTQGSHPNFYALVIGIRGNPFLPPLETPVNDAREVEQTLKDQYGFKTQLLADATRDQIIGALDLYRRSLNENDELLIYYGGHGYYDKDEDQAYWAPVDAGKDTYARWITATDITGAAKAIPARHILIISDSCYSGMLTRDVGVGPGAISDDRSVYLARMLERKSRNIMSSGGDEPVQDNDGTWGPSNHSVFANVLLRNLVDPPGNEFTASELFSHVALQVAARSRQTPTYSPIRNSLHDEGDFVFYRIGTASPGEVQPLPRVSLSPLLPVDPEKDAIEVSLSKYEDAYASMDMRLMKEVWPSLSRAQEKALSQATRAPGLKAVKVQLKNKVATHDGDTAKVDCDQWMVYTWVGRRQPPQVNSVEIQLAKNQQGSWLVTNVGPK